MADEDIKSEQTEQPEEEYQFTDQSIKSDVFAAAKPKKTPRFGKLNKRNILIIVGVLVIVIAVYKLIEIFLEPSTATKKTTTTVTKTVQQPQQTTQLQQQTEKIPSFQQQSSQLNEEVKNRLQTLQTSTEQSTSKIGTVNQQLSQLSNSVANVQSTLQAISNQLQSINSTLQQQQAEIAVLKAQKRPVYKPRVVRKRYRAPRRVIKRTVYYIQAMLPGRAWLILPNGSTITVTVGSRLPGYGRVRSIDPIRGIVKTSSGAIIRYKSG